MLRKASIWALILVIFAGVGGGVYFYTAKSNITKTSSESETALQTAIASRGDLVILATGTGSLVPARQISLGFKESGTLIELNVREGDNVKAGQVLARLETDTSAETIAAQVAEAELAVIQAQSALDELFENAEIARTEALNNISTYSEAVKEAQWTLANYTMPIYLQGLSPIEAMEKMKAALEQATQEFEPYKYLSEYNPKREEMLEKLNIALANYNAAVDRLNKEYALQVAQANLLKARQDYEKVKDGPAEDELAEAQAVLKIAQTKLALAQAEQPVLELVAPFDGVILSVDAVVGQAVGEAKIITLADMVPITLEVYLDESDLDKVAVDCPAEVTFDAYPDTTFTGVVTLVSRSLQSVSDVSAVKALVQLDSEGIGASRALPVGLSASVDVIAGRATNAVLVPIEALRDLGDGQYAVFVVVNGLPELRMVEVGLMDATSAEIKSGLEAGELVSTGSVPVQ